jgi:AraC family transcriptional regulator of adaptative response/methylated-DNA-[protein]-cysteine methyltransferase
MPATLERQPETTEDQWWRAVQERDSRMAGRFIVAVRSTGIFCRPGCPARMPHRENVAFFTTPEEAAAAGFRPCLRCHPTEPHRLDVEIVRAARNLFELSESYPGVPAMAEVARVSEHALRVAFQRVLGVTPRVAWEQSSLTQLMTCTAGTL